MDHPEDGCRELLLNVVTHKSMFDIFIGADILRHSA
jgi:hypothetical protein